MARVEYAVVLQDADGVEVDRFDFAEFIDVPDTPTAVFNYSGAWHTALDGDYTVTGDFTVYDIFGDGYNISTGSFNADLACGSAVSEDPDPSEPCIKRVRYWIRHPDAWPVTGLEIAGQEYDQNELRKMMTKRRRRFLTFHLTRQLIAAKLNLANGTKNEILPVVDKADALLADRQTNRRARGRNHRRTIRLTVALFMYNRGGCPDGADTGMTVQLGEDFAKSLEQGADEVMTIGSIKAMYR